MHTAFVRAPFDNLQQKHPKLGSWPELQVPGFCRGLLA